jgi:hypothetical protein
MPFAVVFGSVLEGMGVVKRMEAMGSKSGVTARRVTVEDCGELESRLQRAIKLAAEKEQLEAAKKDPLGLDPDAQAVDRLRALRGDPAVAADAEMQPEQDVGGAAEETGAGRVRGEDGVAAADAGRACAEHEGLPTEGEEPADDVLAGLSTRKRKLIELRAKSAKARKANEHATIAEFKRLKKGPTDSHMERKKWLDADKKERTVCPLHARDCSDHAVCATKIRATTMANIIVARIRVHACVTPAAHADGMILGL